MPHSTGERHKINYIMFLCIGLLVLLPFLFLTLYNHPQADDFGFAVRDMTYGFWETQVNYYMNWTGRYFSTTTAFQINPVIYGNFDRYKVYSLLLILLLVVSTCLFLHKLLQRHFNVLKTLALAALLLCLYLMQLPSVSEGMFWLPGYLTYQLPNIMLLLLLALLISFFRTGSSNYKVLYVAFAALLCVAVVGSNEMSIVMAFTTILFILYHNRNDRQNRLYLLCLFILCVVAILAAVLAPGNYARMEEHPNASKPLWATIYAAFLTVLSFYRWLAPILVASVLYVIYWGLPLADKTKASSFFEVNLRLSLCHYIVTLFLMQFAFTWAVGERPTPRVENVIYFFFVFGWFYNVQVALTKYAHLLQAERRLSPILPLAVMFLFILQVFAIDGNIATAYTDLLSGKATAYNSALNQRYAYLKESDCDTCSLAPLPAIPKTLYFMDVVEGEENSSFWVNIDYADYWSKSAVYLTAPNPEIKDNVTTLREAGKELIGN
ncbi:hypothetical protein DXT99_07855 [Pontibacter diazotrophicus]|uniref:Uncharacterized protein n=1 Tax=Pontibacter diazotrophicus TaxID=1400979 RepID=A0A3D8LF64_9BACT|nr:DUF6056 family protein [Pontibacter diazotrophicus]RDV15894.1 hypothetical protein DXT99_07855 [Pontibacter diazotrophicus]